MKFQPVTPQSLRPKLPVSWRARETLVFASAMRRRHAIRFSTSATLWAELYAGRNSYSLRIRDEWASAGSQATREAATCNGRKLTELNHGLRVTAQKEAEQWPSQMSLVACSTREEGSSQSESCKLCSRSREREHDKGNKLDVSKHERQRGAFVVFRPKWNWIPRRQTKTQFNGIRTRLASWRQDWPAARDWRPRMLNSRARDGLALHLTCPMGHWICYGA